MRGITHEESISNWPASPTHFYFLKNSFIFFPSPTLLLWSKLWSKLAETVTLASQLDQLPDIFYPSPPAPQSVTLAPSHTPSPFQSHWTLFLSCTCHILPSTTRPLCVWSPFPGMLCLSLFATHFSDCSSIPPGKLFLTSHHKLLQCVALTILLIWYDYLVNVKLLLFLPACVMRAKTTFVLLILVFLSLA